MSYRERPAIKAIESSLDRWKRWIFKVVFNIFDLIFKIKLWHLFLIINSFLFYYFFDTFYVQVLLNYLFYPLITLAFACYFLAVLLELIIVNWTRPIKKWTAPTIITYFFKTKETKL